MADTPTTSTWDSLTSGVTSGASWLWDSASTYTGYATNPISAVKDAYNSLYGTYAEVKSSKTELSSSPRNKNIVGDTIHFPTGLNSKRYIKIQIFDTTKHMQDPNKPIATGAKAVVDQARQLVKGEIPGTIEIDNLSELGGDAVKLVKDDFAPVAAAWEQYTSTFTDVGNPALSENFKDNIFLPLPNELEESLSHTWSNDNKGLVQSIPGAEMLGTGVAKVSDLVSLATGTQALVFNHNKRAKFIETEFRSITLTWTLVPNNHNESIAIQSIITKLKAYSSPQAVGGKSLLRAPFFARLHFDNSTLNDALQFKEVVMTNISVNYSVSGFMETFDKDDMPKNMSLSITFQDREPKTLQAWGNGMYGEAGYGGDGLITPAKIASDEFDRYDPQYEGDS